MKSFKSVLHEAPQQKTRVLLFGRMNPITRGHEENVNAAHAIAQRHGAELHVIASHSHDPKKNPLSPEQKTTHLKRAFGHLSNTHVGTSSKESPTILHQAAEAHRAGVKHLVIAGGGDRAAEYHKLLNTYNGHEGGRHGYYKFKKISIENTGERKEGVSGTDMRKHASSGNFNKFREGLPSKIAKNEKHSQAMYNDVRHGMGVHEDTRDTYISGDRLRLGETVVDTFTGIEGKIVYRGPTYVTVQIDEDISFKRWIDDVDSTMESTDEPNVKGFKDYAVPADIRRNLLDSVSYCPKAVPAFEKLLGNGDYDQGVVLEALDATAHYLAIERRAAEMPGSVDDHGLTQFNEHLRHASQLLSTLGVLDQHRSYIEMHAHKMQELVRKVNVGEAKTHEIQGHQDITDDDLKSIEKHIDSLEWDDIKHLYADQEHGEAEEEEYTPAGDSLDEALSAQQRIKKKFDFLKSKSKREIAATIARHRVSTPERMKKRAVTHARTLIMQRLMGNRQKSQLSAAEKDRIETIVKKSKGAIVRISNRLLPKLRQLEMKRMRHVQEEYPSTISDMGTYGETGNVSTSIDSIDTGSDQRLERNKKRLSGENPDATDTDQAKPEHGSVKRLKHYRKLEV